jgi:hypothetical protein
MASANNDRFAQLKMIFLSERQISHMRNEKLLDELNQLSEYSNRNWKTNNQKRLKYLKVSDQNKKAEFNFSLKFLFPKYLLFDV